MESKFANATHIYFIGVVGIGVSALVRLAAAQGKRVSGTDLSYVGNEGLPTGTYHNVHDAAHITPDVDLIIYSPAVRPENPERVAARTLGISELSYPEALGDVTTMYRTVAVSGTHGKSTTTALLGALAVAGALDPTVVVGAVVPGFKQNLRRGNSDLFIVEACEYKEAMRNLHPTIVTLTNLEHDHPDYYHSMDDLRAAFARYIGALSSDAQVVVNADSAELIALTKHIPQRVTTYAINTDADLRAINIQATAHDTTFTLLWNGASLGTFTTSLPGMYNIANILAAVATYLVIGGEHGVIAEVIRAFPGIGRRFEVLGLLDGATVITDYAHHPTALASVVEGTRMRYPGKRILTVFRPHHRERTRVLFDDFVRVCADINPLYLIEIYDVAGREDGTPISSSDILRAIAEVQPKHGCTFLPTIDAAAAEIRAHAAAFDVILVVGAGDADALARSLVQMHE